MKSLIFVVAVAAFATVTADRIKRAPVSTYVVGTIYSTYVDFTGDNIFNFVHNWFSKNHFYSVITTYNS